jgi:PIN domain nuclease of toxin-antitoxin system
VLNLDTHILVHALTGALTPRERAQLSAHPWGVSAIVWWEMAKLVQLGRIDVDLDDHDVGRILRSVHTWPITLEICRAIRRLDFSGDPADELIAATSLVQDVPLVTRDKAIRRSKMVPFAA